MGDGDESPSETRFWETEAPPPPAAAWPRGPDPLDEAIDTAFEKLWKGQPASTLLTGDAEKGVKVCDADSYIQQYFRRVGELTREAVFTEHHVRGLQRYRDDIQRGDRMGRLKDVEEQIMHGQEEEERLHSAITKLMRIVPSPRPPPPTEAGCCAAGARESPCCGENVVGQEVHEVCHGDCVVQ